MARVELKHLHTVKAKSRVYRYAWRGGPRMKADPADAVAFAEEYAAHHRERKGGDRSKVSGLVVAYKASDAWQKDIGDKTRQNWSPWLDRIQDHFGALPVGAFDRPLIRKAIKQWRDRWKATPRTADVGLQVLSRVLSFGVEDGLLAMNACAGIGHLYENDRSDVIWTAEDLAALEFGVPAKDGSGKLVGKAAAEIVHAARLAALTGLRKSDLLLLSWSHIKPHSIEIATGKSGGRKTTLIPIYAELRELLATIPKRSTAVLTNTNGAAWGSGFNSSWQRAKARIRVEKHFHDLRGTAATKMYLGGLTIREIAEVMTWSEDGVERLIRRYVKRDEILLERIRRMDRLTARARTAEVSPHGK